MKYGLIGEKLGHSFSKEIHESIADLEYELCEVAPSELEGFMTQRGFSAVNVTIPYKEAVIPYLDVTDTAARDIGAVNTVVNRDGRLYGYNTDFFGMKSLICRLGLDLSGSTVLILGTGGTSKTASAVARELGAANIVKVSRKGGNDAVTYAEAAEKYRDADFIINTTPVGMFPNVDGSAVDLSDYPCLRGVIDAVYNPLRTDLILDATARSIPAEGGLYMLVAQAVRASELFTGDDRHGVTDKIFAKMLSEKENIFLTGMPGVGKTTVGHLLAGKTGREFIDTDEQIIKKTGMTPGEIFSAYGEKHFRDVETEVIRETVLTKSGAVIATGGGVPMKAENVRMMKRCGRIFFLNRPISDIVPTPDRPTALDRAALEQRFAERYERYLSSADVEIDASVGAEGTADAVLKIFGQYTV